MENARVEQYRQIIQSLSEGQFSIDLPPGPQDELGKLGESLAILAHHLAQTRALELALAQTLEKIVHGMYLNEVMEYVFDAFHSLIPYEGIRCSILESDGVCERIYWEKTDARQIQIQDSYLTYPLHLQGKTAGFLCFFGRRENHYDTAQQEACARLAGLISIILEKNNFHEQLHKLSWELKEAQDALKVNASHDALTGLWNRETILEILAKSLDNATRRRARLGVILADIDQLQRINAVHGYEVGDAVIRSVSKRIEASLRSYDYIGRYQGEEFLAILENCEAADAPIIAERIRQAICASPVYLEEEKIQVAVSIGVVFKTKPVSASKLLDHATEMLNEAKKQGGNTVVFAS
ncbi:MAG: sensor domain-containing diguanylate cyclase [Methylococcaceae bacterium]|nr:sensor domain-containing diguanylate cyclase [Methylococcaceae bacterium]